MKTPASLDVATTMLLTYIAPAVAVFQETGNRLGVEVMFNDHTINSVVKFDSLAKWRKKDFVYRTVRRVKEPIAHAGKWRVLDALLKELDGNMVWYNGDETMRNLVDSLKPKTEKRI